MKLSPKDPGYPPRLCDLDQPPPITVSKPLSTSARAVAIVGARGAVPEAIAFAHALAYHLARAGVTVISGGAKGVDRAAHLGALRGGGSTWCVACTGRAHVFPASNGGLFEELAASESSRMIWPFDDDEEASVETPRKRNGVLVALAECVVIVQAALVSGSRNAATWAAGIGRPCYVVPGMPWDPAYAGSVEVGANGGRPLWAITAFFKELGLAPPNMEDEEAAHCGIMPPNPRIRQRPRRKLTFGDGPLFAVDRSTWSADENLVFAALSIAPTQQDDVVEKTGLTTSSAVTALLTLSLKDVVVEGPDGFFRRRRDP